LQNKFKGKLFGDFDLDGKVTLNDARKALRLSLGIDTATEDGAYLGNLNGRGITLNEVKAFLRMSLGIDKTKQILPFVPKFDRSSLDMLQTGCGLL